MKKTLSTERRRPRVQTTDFDESRTVQSDVHKSDIHHVLKRYKSMGIVDHMANVDLEFRDVTEFEDFADLQLQLSEARHAFMRLPSKLREVFNHDVSTWLDAAHDPEKLQDLRPQLERAGYQFSDEPAPSGPGTRPDDPPARPAEPVE